MMVKGEAEMVYENWITVDTVMKRLIVMAG